jgi:hypothetical protein
MKSCSEGINAANPKVLIFLSGLGYDTDLSPITTGGDLGNRTVFRKSDFPKDKIVLELHNYQNKNTNCGSITSGMMRGGWNAMETNNASVVNVMPVVMTEFGFSQDTTSAASVYATCLKDFFIKKKAGWIVWVIAGSYLIRSGKQDSDEAWGKRTPF